MYQAEVISAETLEELQNELNDFYYSFGNQYEVVSVNFANNKNSFVYVITYKEITNY